MDFDYASLYSLIITPRHPRFWLPINTFDGTGTFKIRSDSNAASKREAFAFLFQLAKVRCIGPVDNKGAPTILRRGDGNHHAIQGFLIRTNGVELQILIKHEGPRPIKTYEEVLAPRGLPIGHVLPTNEDGFTRPALSVLSRYVYYQHCSLLIFNSVSPYGMRTTPKTLRNGAWTRVKSIRSTWPRTHQAMSTERLRIMTKIFHQSPQNKYGISSKTTKRWSEGDSTES